MLNLKGESTIFMKAPGLIVENALLFDKAIDLAPLLSFFISFIMWFIRDPSRIFEAAFYNQISVSYI